jgi:protein tyrosine/serine phosphatase
MSRSVQRHVAGGRCLQQAAGRSFYGGKSSTMLAAVMNFRDFGGYPIGERRSVRTGILFRSGHLAGATEADIEKLTALGLSVIVDLRRAKERNRHPTVTGLLAAR